MPTEQSSKLPASAILPDHEHGADSAHKERPAVYADRIGKIHSTRSSDVHKKEFGQYLTPVIVADFMADMITLKDKESVSLLDPGIGSSILTCTVCEALLKKLPSLRSINVVGYEIDFGVLKQTKKALEYLKSWLLHSGVALNYSLRTEDFVLSNAIALNDNVSLFGSDFEKFDIIISNPPYFKINKNDPRAIAASQVVHGQPNIYALFMAIASCLLKEHGELIFITPRSFSSEQYFKAFRAFFFSRILPLKIHLFGSRKDAFDRDSVLQEHVIIHGTPAQKAPHGKSGVSISFSNGLHDIAHSLTRKAQLKDVIDLNSPNTVLFIPTTDEEEFVVAHVNSWQGSLHKFGMEISTGRIVPFRATHLLRSEGSPATCAPLIWMNHIKDGTVTWPLNGFRKQEFILVSDLSMALLIPNRNYVVMRRFSAKEEHQRINTAPLLKSQLNYEWIGLENHVNYIYKPKGKLTIEEAVGLSAVLNSRYLDIYFRVSNGNTEVSATEIRDMPLPEHDLICRIGHEIVQKGRELVDVNTILTSA